MKYVNYALSYILDNVISYIIIKYKERLNNVICNYQIYRLMSIIILYSICLLIIMEYECKSDYVICYIINSKHIL